MKILFVYTTDSPLLQQMKQISERGEWRIDLINAGEDSGWLARVPDLPDVAIFDGYCDFEAGIELYSQLNNHQQIGSYALIASREYNEDHLFKLGNYPEAAYWVTLDSTDKTAQYLKRYERTKSNLLNGFLTLINDELGRLINQTNIVSITDQSGTIRYANDLFCKISGYEPAELIGKNHRILKSGVHPDDFYEDMWNTISSGKVWQGIVCNHTKQGSPYWVRSEIHPIFGPGDKPVLYISFRTEITKERQLMEQLSMSEERFRISHAFANIGSWEWNIKTNDLYWSKEIHKLFGYQTPVLETTYDNFLDSIHPDDRDYVDQSVNDCVYQGKDYNIEHRVVWPDQSVHWVSERGYVTFDENGQPERMFGIVVDIQKLKSAQQEASSANQAKTTFISSMSHELRNPINAISGYAQLLVDNQQTPADVKDKASKIFDICDYMIDLLGDVDKYSKIDAEKIDINLEEVSIETVLKECKEVVQPLLGELSYFENYHTATVVADRRHLKQAIINFLSNAIKYNSRMGRVFVSSKSLGNGFLRIQVEDTGQGIAKDMLSKIFLPFERLDWDKSEVKGLGLGLALTKTLIEKMHGQVGVKSTPGAGTTIWLDIPESKNTPKKTSAPSSDRPAPIKKPLAETRGKRVLLLEDNIFNQQFMEEQLQLMEFSVDVAANGLEGLRKLEFADYDILLSDCNMPQMDGFEFSREVRKHTSPKVRELPILAITARSSEQSIEDCLASGMNDVLIKPFRTDELKQKISDLLEGKKATPQSATTAQSDSEQIINTEALNQFLGTDDEIQLKLLKVYRETLIEALTPMIAAYGRKDLEHVRATAHKLASSSATIGAESLAKLLLAIEHQIKREDLIDLEPKIQQVEILYPRLLNELDKLILHKEGDQLETSPPDQLPDEGRPLKLLVVDDDQFAISHAETNLANIQDLDVASASSAEQALGKIGKASPPFDVILFDLNMPDVDGLKFVRMISSIYKGEGLAVYSSQTDLVKAVKNLIERHQMRFLGHLGKPILPKKLQEIIDAAKDKNKVRPTTAHTQALSDEDIKTGLSNEAIELVYQPQIDAQNKHILGVEALARFRKNNGETLPPPQFIPAIERLNLDGEFSTQVFKKAVAQLAHWQTLGIQLKAAVNFTMTAIENLELPEVLTDICEKHQVPPQFVIIEVTESAITSEPTVALEVLSRLKLIGFSLSIDDFGTGYSSLDKLQELPFCELKLDRSYVSNALTDDAAMAIMKSSVDLAKQMNMNTVAEGVETQQDFDLAVELGVDIIQGYFISRPMKPEELVTWHSQHISHYNTHSSH